MFHPIRLPLRSIASRDAHRRAPGRVLVACALCAGLVGCSRMWTQMTRGPAPVGPGAATEADVRPWLVDAETTAYAGRLENFLVASQHGAYATWSLVPTGPWVGSEVDIRACAADAQRLRDQQVLIHGKLLERGPRHLPLFVAERITPCDAPPAPLVASSEPGGNP